MTSSQRQPFTPIADPPAQVLAEARARFETGHADLVQMAHDFGMALSTLKHRIRHRWRWQLHRAAPKRPRGKGHARSGTGSGRAVRTRLNGSVRGMLARELTRLEGEFSALPEGDIERTTRVLANLVRILVAMARLDATPQRKSKQETHADQGAPVDLARLRDDLARRLGATGEPTDATRDTREPDAA
jgi:hypothetical protein